MYKLRFVQRQSKIILTCTLFNRGSSAFAVMIKMAQITAPFEFADVMEAIEQLEAQTQATTEESEEVDRNLNDGSLDEEATAKLNELEKSGSSKSSLAQSNSCVTRFKKFLQLPSLTRRSGSAA